jgi:CRISPR-associated protein Csd2
MNSKEQKAMLNTNIPRITGLLIIEVRDSNPNGDPDNAGFPRQRPDGRGEISPPAIKRKQRDLVADKEGLIWQSLKTRLSLGNDAEGRFAILETRNRNRQAIITEMLEENANQDTKDRQKTVFEARYWDARLFGSTFLESRKSVEEDIGRELANEEWQNLQKTIRTGVAHFGVGVSVAPVNVRFETWTNKAGVEEGKDRGLAPQALKFVEHGIYTVPFFVNPTQANKTGCTSQDVELMLHLLKHVFRDNPSTGRTQVELVHGHAVKHKDVLGSFSDFALLDALKPVRKGDPEKPSASRADYSIPTWDDIKANPVRKQGDKILTWNDLGVYMDYSL